MMAFPSDELPFNSVDFAQLKTKLESRVTEIKKTFEKAKTLRSELVEYVQNRNQQQLEPGCLRLLESKIADELLNFSKSFGANAKPVRMEEVTRNVEPFEVKCKNDRPITLNLKPWTSLPALEENRQDSVQLENCPTRSISTNPIDSIRNLEARGCIKDAEKMCLESIKSHFKMIELLKKEKDRLRDVQSNLDVFLDEPKAKLMYPKHLVYQNGYDQYQLDEVLIGLRKTKTNSNIEKMTKKLDLYPITVKKKKVHYWKHRVYPGFGLDIQLEELRVMDRFAKKLKL